MPSGCRNLGPAFGCALVTTNYLARLSLVTVLGLSGFACSDSSDDPMGGCTPGTSDGCAAGQVCSAAGVCEANGTTAGQLVIDAEGARACEILLQGDAAQVARLVSGAGVESALRARPPRYAIALASTSGALAKDAVTLEVEGEPSALTVSSVECFDEAGAPLAGATASID